MIAQTPPRAHVGILDHFEVAGFSWLGPNAGEDRITILVDGVEIGSIPAQTYRPDLQKVGIGDGRCAFRFRFPETQAIFQPVEVDVRSAVTGRTLPNGKKTLIPLFSGGGLYSHSLEEKCYAFAPISMTRDGDNISVTGRALAPGMGELTIEPFQVGSGNLPTITSCEIVNRPHSELSSNTNIERGIDWSFDRKSCHGSQAVGFRLRDKTQPEGYLGSELFEIASSVCIPVVDNWFTMPPEEHYRRTSGNVDEMQLVLQAATHGFKLAALAGHLLPGTSAISVIDWGAGFGRVAMAFKRLFWPTAEVMGFEVDQFNIDWANASLPDILIQRCDFYPPLPVFTDSVDLLYGISVMTHLTESAQEIWLRELQRIIKPGGICVLTTRGDHLLRLQRLRSPEVLRSLAIRGISDVDPDFNLGPKLDNSTFYRGTVQLRRQVETVWARHFEIVAYLPFGFFQDAVVMRKSA
jgi:SAM-dependent methyltransferase